MIDEIDNRPLTKWQWMVMFMGPEWDAATIRALSYSLTKAYEIHSGRINATAPTTTEQRS